MDWRETPLRKVNLGAIAAKPSAWLTSTAGNLSAFPKIHEAVVDTLASSRAFGDHRIRPKPGSIATTRACAHLAHRPKTGSSAQTNPSRAGEAAIRRIWPDGTTRIPVRPRSKRRTCLDPQAGTPSDEADDGTIRSAWTWSARRLDWRERVKRCLQIRRPRLPGPYGIAGGNCRRWWNPDWFTAKHDGPPRDQLRRDPAEWQIGVSGQTPVRRAGRSGTHLWQAAGPM